MSNTINRMSVGKLTVTDKVVQEIGTNAGGVTTETRGDGVHNRTTITIPSGKVIGSVSATTSGSYGALLYTFPAGIIQVDTVYCSLNPPSGVATGTTTVDLGIGTVQGSGAVSELSASPSAATSGQSENLLTGQTVTPTAAAATAVISGGAGDVGSSIEILAAAAHTVYLNVAAVWDATGSFTCPGTVVIDWKKLT